MNFVELRTGDLTAVIGDNIAHGEHRPGYNGVWRLTSLHEQRNLFVPEYAGLNLEHIFDGVPMGDRFFEPRQAPMELAEVQPGEAVMHQAPTYHSRLESWITFRLSPPHFIDLDHRCIPHEPVFAYDYIGLFWASYINGPMDKSIYFPRGAAPDGSVVWQQFCTQWHGRDSTVLADDDETTLPGKPDVNTLFSAYSQVRFALPLYYGRFGDMVLIYIFDRKAGVRFSHSPSGGGRSRRGDDTNPAWDFQFVIQPWEGGKEYRFGLRVVYKKWAGREDVLEMYREYRGE